MEYLISLKDLNNKVTLEKQNKKNKAVDLQIRTPEGGEVCRNCGTKMERRGWKRADKKRLERPFYYAQWDKCSKCGNMYHYEKYKVTDKRQPWELEIFK